jgi:hypothetical protein
LEYFCAASFVREFEKTKNLTLDDIKKDVFGSHADDPSWREVLRLICSMIDEKWVGDIISYLVNEVNSDWRDHLETREPWHLALAVGCLSEVRNFALVAKPARELLQAVCDYLDNDGRPYKKERDDCYKVILTAASYIGKNWPNREDIITHPLLDAKNTNRHFYSPIAQFVSCIGADCEPVRKFVLSKRSRSRAWRLQALYILGRGWPQHTDTRKFICSCAKDKTMEVRSTSISLLSSLYPQQDWAIEIMRSAVNDDDNRVRVTALNSLVSCCPDDPETLNVLIAQVQEGNASSYHTVRKFQLLIEHYRDRFNPVPLLRLKLSESQDFAQEMFAELLLSCFPQDEEVKKMLLTKLNKIRQNEFNFYLEEFVEHFKNDSDVVQAVRNAASSPDVKPAMRIALLGFSIQHHSHNKDTLAFLRDRAEKEGSPRVKKVAREGAKTLEEVLAE